MARREARDKKMDDFLKRLFDEPAAGKSPKSRPSKSSRRAVSRAQLLAVLEAATEQGEEGIVLDDALLAAYLDGALGEEEQVALEGLLARSHDLRDQLAAAGEAREAVLVGKAKMPKSYIEDFDAVPAPRVRQPARQEDTARTNALSRWLAGVMPGRRWAMAALPAIIAVVVVAVIGPNVYSPAKLESPEAQKTIVGGTLADKDTMSKSANRKRRSKFVSKEKSPRTGAASGRSEKRSLGGASGASGSRRSNLKNKAVAGVLVPLDDDSRAALVRLGLRQNRTLSAAGSAYGRTGAKQEAVKPPAKKSPAVITPAPKPPASVAEERNKREEKAKTEVEKTHKSAASVARKPDLRNQPSALDKTVEKNCPSGMAKCCERRKVAPKLLRRLLAGGPPLQEMKIIHLSPNTCLLTLPVAETGK